MPKFSVITTLFNKAAYVEQTLESMIRQTMPDWELIVVDNGSTDIGPEIVQSYQKKDSRISLTFCSKRGPGAARNYGLVQSSGEWILFLDADDLLAPSYFETRLQLAQQYQDADLIIGQWEDFTDECPDQRILRQPAGFGRSVMEVEAAAFAYAPWALHAAMIRRSRLCQLSPCWKEELDSSPSEDTAFWFPVVHEANICWTSDAGALYRKHTHNSRDLGLESVQTSFNASYHILRTNLAFLNKIGKQPTPRQAANTVRMLRAMLVKAASNPSLFREIRQEIRYWLRHTSYSDPKMLYRRLQFIEPRHL